MPNMARRACWYSPSPATRAQCPSVIFCAPRGQALRAPLGVFGLQEQSIAGRAPRRPIPSCRPWPDSAAAGLLVAIGQWQGWGGHFGASRTIFRPETRRVPLAAMRGWRRRVKFIENLVTGERHVLKWGGARLRLDQQQDPALLFRCLT